MVHDQAWRRQDVMAALSNGCAGAGGNSVRQLVGHDEACVLILDVEISCKAQVKSVEANMAVAGRLRFSGRCAVLLRWNLWHNRLASDHNQINQAQPLIACIWTKKTPIEAVAEQSWTASSGIPRSQVCQAQQLAQRDLIGGGQNQVHSGGLRGVQQFFDGHICLRFGQPPLPRRQPNFALTRAALAQEFRPVLDGGFVFIVLSKALVRPASHRALQRRWLYVEAATASSASSCRRGKRWRCRWRLSCPSPPARPASRCGQE